MKLFLLSLFFIGAFVTVKAQTATITPANASIGVNSSQTFTVVTSGYGGDDNNRTFAYTITGPGATIPATPTSINCTSGCNNETHTFEFNTVGVYTVSVTVTQTQGGAAVASTSTTISVVDPLPIGCDGKFFVSYDNGGSTGLDSLVFSGSVIDNFLFPTTTTLNYNGIGLNPVDGFIYGFSSDDNLIKVGRNPGLVPPNQHIVQDLGAVSPAPGETIYAGSFNSSGDFYYVAGNQFRYIPNANLNTTRVSTALPNLNGSGDNAPASGTWIIDIAFNPVNGKLYGVSLGGNTANVNDFRLYEINTTTGALTRLGAAGANTTGQVPHLGDDYIAALFFDELGNLYGYRQDGSFLLMDLVNPQSSSVTGTGAAYNSADGCSCSFGRVFHDLNLPGSNQICPVNDGTNLGFDITVSVSNQSSGPKTGLTYTLEIPGNRFSIIESAATISTRLFTAGLVPADIPANVVISSTSGTNNKIVVTGFQTGASASTLSFTLKLKLINFTLPFPASVNLQSSITGLPPEIGSSDLSNDPETGAPDDPTAITFCSILPVNLLNFTAIRNNVDVNLKWETNNEVNNSGFDVERLIGTGGWQKIGFVASQGKAGSSNNNLIYNFTDANNTNRNISQYRLKQIDIDKNVTYSMIRVVNGMDQKGKTIVFPNPSKDGKVNVLFDELNVVRNISLIDNNGRTVKQWRGVNGVNFQMDNLKAGFYTLRIENTKTKEQTVEKIVVNK